MYKISSVLGRILLNQETGEMKTLAELNRDLPKLYQSSERNNDPIKFDFTKEVAAEWHRKRAAAGES